MCVSVYMPDTSYVLGLLLQTVHEVDSQLLGCAALLGSDWNAELLPPDVDEVGSLITFGMVP